MSLTPKIKNEDWTSVRQAIAKLKTKLGPQAEPTFAGVTLTGLTATRLIQSDADKALASVATLSSWIAGTANEINISDDGDGTITIGIVDPLIVAKGGTGVATLTDHGILLGSGTGAVTPLGVAANGQIPIGSVGADPVLAEITGTANQVVSTPGAGTITLSLPQDIHTGATPTFAGGTFTGVVTGVIPTAAAHLATKEYVDLSLGAFKTFFLSDTSGVGALNFAYPHETGEAQSSIVTAGLGLGDGQLVKGFITEAGEPATTTLHDGVTTFHFHAKKGASNQRTTVLYAVLSWVDADGTSNKTTVTTTELSGELTDTETTYEIHTALGADVEIASTARLILDVYANVGSGAQNSVVTLYMEGTEDSYFTTEVDSGLWQNHGDVLDDLNTLGAVGANSEFLVGTGAGAFAWESGTTVRTSIGLGTGDSPQFTGLTLSALTLGSVIFAGASGVISQDNANIFYDDANNRLGIGTASPVATLDVRGDIFTDRWQEDIRNTFIGINVVGAGNLTGTGNQGALSTAIGNDAMYSMTTGERNTAIGERAMRSATITTYSVAIGATAAYSLTTGDRTTAIGAEAGYYNVTGDDNTTIGARAGFGQVGNSYTAATLIGSLAGSSLTSGANITAVGRQALNLNEDGYSNTVIGSLAVANNVSGYWITAIGVNALNAVTAGPNTAIGTSAMVLTTTGINNAAVGSDALHFNTIGANNTGVGARSMDGNTTGDDNTAIGQDSGYRQQAGDHNVFIGSDAGNGDDLNWTGSRNTVIGFQTMFNVETGADDNTLIGYQAGVNITTGSSNILIGSGISAASATGDNELNIGDLIYGDMSNGRVGIGAATPGARLDLGIQAPGIDTPFLYWQAFSANGNNAMCMGSVYDSGQVDQYIMLGCYFDGGTAASPTFFGSPAGGAIIRDFRTSGNRRLEFGFVGNGATQSPTIRMTIEDASGKVGIGTPSPKTLLTVEGGITLKERADHETVAATYGQIWCKTATPNQLWFTDDGSNDYRIAPQDLQISASPTFSSLSVVSAIGAGAVIASLVVADIFQDRSLVGWWQFAATSGTTIGDSADNDNDVTITAGTASTGVLTLDGTQFGNTNKTMTDLGILNSDNLTISVWFRTSKTGEHQYIVNNYHWGWVLRIDSADNKLYIENYQSAGNYRRNISNNAVTDGLWHAAQVICYGDGSSVDLILDGVTQSNAVDVGTVNQLGDSNEYISIGRRSSEANRYFWGDIDDVMLFKRALTEPEMREIYDYGDKKYLHASAGQFGGIDNHTEINGTGDLSFAGSAGFYPRRINQSAIPAAGTGATQVDTGEIVMWRDSDDGVVSFVYNDVTTGIKSVALA